TLPNNWTAKEIYADSIPRKKETGKNAPVGKGSKKDDETNKKEDDSKKKKVEKKVESSSSSSESSDEEEYGEERDLFVAQLYKFQEERGTPINRAPILGGRDIDLYRFYRVVQYYGGCKRVTTNQLWRK
ncbi:ARID/BRIGHT DNA binding domain protein, partial [Teladorsagia circumcincta]